MRTTIDRFGYRSYVWPTGHIVSRDGSGRMCWTLYYRDGTTAFFHTLGEAKASFQH